MKKINLQFTFLSLMLIGFISLTSCGNQNAQKEEAKQENVEQEAAAAKEEAQTQEEAKEKPSMFAKLDKDQDGKLSKEEFVGQSEMVFKEKDKNNDGKLDAEECPMVKAHDSNGDGAVSLEEFTAGREKVFVEKIDVDKDGFVTEEEMANFKDSMKKEGKCGEGKEGKEEMKCGEGKCGK
jgi:Ca2+-binding EF-hand superfamily protein